MKIAVVQIRWTVRTGSKIKDTLKLLRLTKKNSCVLLENNPVYLGMLVKLKDFVTWGEVNNETLKSLIEKRGRIAGNKPLTLDYLNDKIKMDFNGLAEALEQNKLKLKDIPGVKTFFRLKPPIHGFERKGIKAQFSLGGALGYRGENINDLIRRML